MISQLDTVDEHVNDTVVAGDYLCDEKAVRALCTDGKSAIEKLVEIGTRFTKAEELEAKNKQADAVHAVVTNESKLIQSYQGIQPERNHLFDAVPIQHQKTSQMMIALTDQSVNCPYKFPSNFPLSQSKSLQSSALNSNLCDDSPSLENSVSML